MHKHSTDAPLIVTFAIERGGINDYKRDLLQVRVVVLVVGSTVVFCTRLQVEGDF